MKILIVAATKVEVRPLADKFAYVQKEDDSLAHYQFRNDKVDILVTGMGMTATAFYLGKQLPASNYDVVFNAGICGSYSGLLPIGKVVNITEEVFCDLGAEINDHINSIFELGLMDPDEPPFRSGKLLNNSTPKGSVLRKMDRVRGITANTIHGHPDTIRKIREQFNPEVESMEGAAFFYSCLTSGVPFHQVRCISNFVEERDKSKWDIPLAIANLNTSLFDIIKEQSSK
jgi:futalosine hydrolase